GSLLDSRTSQSSSSWVSKNGDAGDSLPVDAELAKRDPAFRPMVARDDASEFRLDCTAAPGCGQGGRREARRSFSGARDAAPRARSRRKAQAQIGAPLFSGVEFRA